MTIGGDARAFLAGARKEWRSLRRYPTWFLTWLFWPALLPAVYVLMGQAFSGSGDPRAIASFAERSGTPNVVGFIFVGYAMYMWLSTLLWGPGTSLRMEQLRGTLESVFVTPVSRLVILFAPALAHVPILLLSYAVALGSMWLFFGVVPGAVAVLWSLVLLAVAVPSLYALASLFSAFVVRYGEVGPIVQLVRGTLTLACGITFPVAMLPGWAQGPAEALPPTRVVAGMRGVLLSGVPLDALGGEMGWLLVSTAALALAAALLFAYVMRGARRTGMLGRY